MLDLGVTGVRLRSRRCKQRSGPVYEVRGRDQLTVDNSTGVRIYDWDSIWGITSILSIALLVAFITMFKNDIPEKAK